MKQQYIFPAVLYFDEENNSYAVAFHDLDVFTEGETVEEAFKSSKDYLCAYLKCSMHVNGEVEKASSYVVVKKEHEAEIVLLVDSEFDEEQTSGKFMEDLFDE